MSSKTFDIDDLLSRLDFCAIEDATNKIDECEFFLSLASVETSRSRFRWLISAFLNAAYSYFEMSALSAFFAFTDEEGEMHPDADSIDVLRGHVRVFRNQSRREYVKTSGLSPLTVKLYEVRRKSTHHFPLAIMEAGSDLPNDFHFGNMRDEGEPVLPFCVQVMELVRSVQQELSR